ncbi:unnamed protein product [Diabrotica balteata]|uniref:Uncharacterized protein n=1 Tax=Diabrotica balteata TaxID=107213 RepID=A0A9N9SWJ8_DIABA|nr:unnamed protein product [Diabrotica balteata]
MVILTRSTKLITSTGGQEDRILETENTVSSTVSMEVKRRDVTPVDVDETEVVFTELVPVNSFTDSVAESIGSLKEEQRISFLAGVLLETRTRSSLLFGISYSEKPLDDSDKDRDYNVTDSEDSSEDEYVPLKKRKLICDRGKNNSIVSNPKRAEDVTSNKTAECVPDAVELINIEDRTV